MGRGQHEDGFGLAPSDEVLSPHGFDQWLARIEADSACRYRWIVEGDRVVGGIALRAVDDEHTRWAGHVGYGVRPSARGRGLATWALRRMLEDARRCGRSRLLLVCDVGNAASAQVIERCGGVLEGVGDTPLGPARRYWIELHPS